MLGSSAAGSASNTFFSRLFIWSSSASNDPRNGKVYNSNKRWSTKKPVLSLYSGRTVSAINPPHANLKKSWHGSTFLSICLRRSAALMMHFSDRQTSLLGPAEISPRLRLKPKLSDKGTFRGRKGPATAPRMTDSKTIPSVILLSILKQQWKWEFWVNCVYIIYVPLCHHHCKQWRSKYCANNNKTVTKVPLILTN